MSGRNNTVVTDETNEAPAEPQADQALTPYGAAKVANEIITAAGLKAIPPQMVYNYTSARARKGLKPMIATEEDGKILTSTIKAWAAEYVIKKAARVSAKEAQLAADLAGEEGVAEALSTEELIEA